MGKIFIHNAVENIGPLDRCSICGVEQSEFANAYGSWHMDDCEAVPLSSDLEARIEAHVERNVEELNLGFE